MQISKLVFNIYFFTIKKHLSVSIKMFKKRSFLEATVQNKVSGVATIVRIERN